MSRVFTRNTRLRVFVFSGVVCNLVLILFGGHGSVLGQSKTSASTSNDPNQLPESWITVRMLPNVKLETLISLANGTVPERRIIKAGEDLRPILIAKYGSANDKIVSLFKLSNPGIDSLTLTKDTMVVLPAGPKWNLDRVVVPLEGETSWKRQTEQEIGTRDSKVLREVAAINPGLEPPRSHSIFAQILTAPVGAIVGIGKIMAGSGDDSASNKPSSQKVTKVALPYTTRFATFPLAAKTQTERSALFAQLRADSGVVSLELVPPAKLFPHWILPENATVSSSPTICSQQPSELQWSNSSLGIHDVQAKDVDALRDGDKVVIAVLDSGIVRSQEDPDKPDQRFFYWHNTHQNSNVFTCQDDDIGCDMIGGGFPLDDMASTDDPDRFRNHGTHVAGIATGRLLDTPLKTAVDKRLQLMVLKVADSEGTIDPTALSNAIPYALQNGASIVNLSFAIPKLSTLYYLVKDEGRNTLFVAAAGNGRNNTGVDITDEQQRYLNTLHQEFPTNFITVAAQKPGGDLACFSNFSTKIVDIAAPGLEIDSTVGNSMTLQLSGTSQAAPYVAFTAALLKSLGVKEPGDIKDRIIASTDFVPALKNKVSSAGKLNIAKAIAIKDDIIEVIENVSATTTTRQILFGKIKSPDFFQVPGTPIPRQDIRKITFGFDESNSKIRRVFYIATDPSTGKRRMIPYIGELELDSVEFLVNGETEPRTFRSEQIIDLIPALP